MVAGMVVVALLAGCDNAFEPIAPGGPPMSVFGYLDASADTQWIRVNLLRTTLLASADSLPILVTLENLGTGHVVQLRDTVRNYVTMLGSEPVYAHNFWTTERIEPGATYRVRAQGTASPVVESVIHVPPDYLVEVWVRQPASNQSSVRSRSIRVMGLDELAFVFGYLFNDDACFASGACRDIIYPPFARDSSGWSIVSNVRRTYRAPGDPAEYGAVKIVGSGSPWPFGQDYSTWRLAPDSASNITGAMGFLGGVLTKGIPVEDCALPYPSPAGTYCKLRYDSTTATLRGTAPVASPTDTARIELLELEPPVGERARTRFGKTDAAGTFTIGAIRPGRHEITIRASHCMLSDTLQFVAGQLLNYVASTCR